MLQGLLRTVGTSGTGGGSTPSAPAGVSGLVGWWDASVFASLTFSGSTVLTAADQSGGGNTMGQYSGSNRPTYDATGFNSRPTFVFAGASTQVLGTVSAFPIGNGAELTAWFVGTMDASCVSFGRPVSYNDPSVGSQDHNSIACFCINRISTNSEIAFTRIVDTNHPVFSLNTNYRVIVTVKSDGSIVLYINGVSSGTATQSGSWATGGTARIGSSTVGNFWGGKIAEAGIANVYSDATNVALLDSYLQTKWGL